MSATSRKDPKTPGPLVDAVVLSSLRQEIGRRAAEGREDAGASLSTIAATLEDEPLARAVLDEAADDRRRRDPHGRASVDSSPRQRRVDREAEAQAALGRLTLSGQLVADGLDRVVLPGFGTGTWRAIGLLRSHDRPLRPWATAVAAGPAQDLGSAGPSFLGELRPDPRLAEPAGRLHLVQARRQDIRNALLVTEFAIGVALDADNQRGVESLRSECDARVRQLEHLDAELERAWSAGVAAASYAGAP